MSAIVRAVLSVAYKDIRSSLAERAFTFTTVIIPINYLALFTIIAASGARAPIAVVMDDHGSVAQSLLSAMSRSRSFVIHVVGHRDAAQLFDDGAVVAVVTIPAALGRDLQSGHRVSIPVTLNNLNVDFTDDIRRALPLSTSAFISARFPGDLPVQTKEIDDHPREPSYLQYVAVSSVVIAVALGGMLPAGTLAAREYETGTLKALLLAPAGRTIVQLGRILGGAVLGVTPILILMAITIGVVGVRPAHPVELAAATLVVLVLFVAIGNLVGNLVRHRAAVIPICAGIGTPLFAVGGAFIPVSWEHPVIAVAAHASPTYYALAAFQAAFYGVSSTPQSLAVNLIALTAFAVAAITVSIWLLRRYEVVH